MGGVCGGNVTCLLSITVVQVSLATPMGLVPLRTDGGAFIQFLTFFAWCSAHHTRQDFLLNNTAYVSNSRNYTAPVPITYHFQPSSASTELFLGASTIASAASAELCRCSLCFHASGDERSISTYSNPALQISDCITRSTNRIRPNLRGLRSGRIRQALLRADQSSTPPLHLAHHRHPETCEGPSPRHPTVLRACLARVCNHTE